jgi:hypothetical protein
MASFTFNQGSLKMADRTIDYVGGTTKLMLVTAIPSIDATDISGFTELSVTGYVPGFASTDRRTLAGKTITVDMATDRVLYDATDPSVWAALAAGGTIVGAVVYNHLTSDALSVPLFFIDLPDTATNGGQIGVTFSNSPTMAYIQQ